MNKIFNKIFANRIQGHNKNIILNDQVGFTPVVQGLFNTCKGKKSHGHCNRYRNGLKSPGEYWDGEKKSLNITKAIYANLLRS